MKVYKLPFVLRGPEPEEEKPFVAEIPVLPGCRAWGDTAAEAIENLQGLAEGFIESHRDRGDPLPPAVLAALPDLTPVTGEVLVAG